MAFTQANMFSGKAGMHFSLSLLWVKQKIILCFLAQDGSKNEKEYSEVINRKPLYLRSNRNSQIIKREVTESHYCQCLGVTWRLTKNSQSCSINPPILPSLIKYRLILISEKYNTVASSDPNSPRLVANRAQITQAVLLLNSQLRWGVSEMKSSLSHQCLCDS